MYYSYDTYDEVDMKDLIFRTISQVEKRGDELHFYTECGYHYAMFHRQSCCESVYIDHIDGDLDRLVGGMVMHASESTDSGPCGEYGESVTWTFYRIRTDKEFVHITWRGSSNGYYSERVTFIRFKKTEDDENGFS